MFPDNCVSGQAMPGEAAVEEVGGGGGIIRPGIGFTPSAPRLHCIPDGQAGIEAIHLLFTIVQQHYPSVFVGDAVIGADPDSYREVFLHVVHGVLPFVLNINGKQAVAGAKVVNFMFLLIICQARKNTCSGNQAGSIKTRCSHTL